MKRLALALQVFLLCMWGMAAPPASAQSVDTGILGTVAGCERRGHSRLGRSPSRVPRPASSRPSSADRTAPSRSAISLPGDYVVQAALAGLPHRAHDGHAARRAAGAAELRAAGRQHRRSGRRRRRRACCSRRRAASPATSSPRRPSSTCRSAAATSRTLGNLTAGVVASGDAVPRQRRPRHVSAGVVRRRQRAQQPRQQPVHVSRRSTRSRSSRCRRPTTPRSTADTPAPTCSCSSSRAPTDLHGSVFEYVRNDAMDARNFFAPAPSPKPQLDRHQFGGVIGGPVRRNQTFFMCSYEGVRETRETVAQTNVLTEAMRRGDFSGVAGAVIRDPLTGLQFPEQHHPEQPSRSARGLDGQPVSAAAEPDRRQQLPRRDAGRGHAEPVHHPRRPRARARSRRSSATTSIRAATIPTTPINPDFPAPRRLQQPQRGGAARDDLELARS